MLWRWLPFSGKLHILFQGQTRLLHFKLVCGLQPLLVACCDVGCLFRASFIFYFRVKHVCFILSCFAVCSLFLWHVVTLPAFFGQASYFISGSNTFAASSCGMLWRWLPDCSNSVPQATQAVRAWSLHRVKSGNSSDAKSAMSMAPAMNVCSTLSLLA